MNIRFHIDYRTQYGERLYITTLGPAAADYAMETADGRHWEAEAEVLARVGSSVDYAYSVRTESQTTRVEWILHPHRLEFVATKSKTYEVYDRWIDIPEDAYLYSSAVAQCVEPHTIEASGKSPAGRLLRLKVRAPQLRHDERLAITGEGKYLGQWFAGDAIDMREHGAGEWVATLDAGQLRPDMEFKFVARCDSGERMTMWERGFNRHLSIADYAAAADAGAAVVVELPPCSFDRPGWRAAGTVIPVFSLRSEGSFGVGDFGDLQRMIHWVAFTEQRVLQVLPINDTTFNHTWTDSYPYNCTSSFALHPQYIDLRQLPPLADASRAAHYEALRRELNALPEIDYERANNAKRDYMRELYAQEGAATLRSQAFKTFFAANRHWLIDYATFAFFRDKYRTADFRLWPDHKRPDDKEREQRSRPASRAFAEVAFWYYLQFLLDTQMRAAHDAARQERVILKGDIPIGVCPHSVDVWADPDYFNLDGSAGAPPDAFSTNGQNWGFPTYNWDAMLADGCQWWQRRLRKMAEYFDAYRIDHVLGFFRIWEIPTHSVHGLLGQFSPALPLSVAEIENYGLPFREAYLHPYISDWTLDKLFGERADEVKATFLDNVGEGRWQMKPAYDTQRKVEAAFRGARGRYATSMRDGLYALISNVLFVRDRRQEGMFHPRIAAQNDLFYQMLTDSEKAAFNRLYDEYFYRRNSHYWYAQAMEKLPRIVWATDMLACAEDLGMVPECVPWVMEQLRILSLEIQTMPKEYGVRFGHLSRYPYRSVCTISTHDTPTLRQWWDEDSERTQDYYNSMLYKSGGAAHPLSGWLAKEIIARHMACPSMLCVLTFQDWTAMDERLRYHDQNGERINIPATPRHYWRYRMHITIERLMAATDFNDNIRQIVAESGRK